MLQRLLGPLPGHSCLSGAALRVEARRSCSLAHGEGRDPRGGDEDLGGLDIYCSSLAVRRAEEVEVGVETYRAEERWRGVNSGVGGEDTGSVGDGGAADAHEAVVRSDERIFVKVEAERAEEARVLLENTVGAVVAGVSAVADVVDVERQGLCGAADVAVRQRGLPGVHGGGGGGESPVRTCPVPTVTLEIQQ